ncbi:MAG: haloacid dehalogenase [Sulfurimonadaceae bacterium]
MKEIRITVPHYKTLILRHVVLDYNGTLAEDGELKEEAKLLLNDLVLHYEVHVITSDTFGSVKEQLDSFDVTIRVLKSDDHTAEKASYIDELGSEHCAAVGNGNNDANMLKAALLGIALIGDEGCSTQTLLNSDIVCRSIEDALALLLSEKRMIATLRK